MTDLDDLRKTVFQNVTANAAYRGEEVTYTPPAGAAQTEVPVKIDRKPIVSEYSWGESQTERWQLRVHEDDVTTLVKEGVFLVGGKSYMVEEDPTTEGGEHVVLIVLKEQKSFEGDRLRIVR